MPTSQQILGALPAYCALLASQRPGKTFTFSTVSSGRMKGWLLIRETFVVDGVTYGGSFMFVGKSSGLMYWPDGGRNGARVGGGTVVDAVRVTEVMAS